MMNFEIDIYLQTFKKLYLLKKNPLKLCAQNVCAEKKISRAGAAETVNKVARLYPQTIGIKKGPALHEKVPQCAWLPKHFHSTVPEIEMGKCIFY